MNPCHKSAAAVWLRRSLQVAVLFAAVASHGADLKLGAAAININPPLGIGLSGYYHARGSDGVLDDLFAKATVLDDGQTRAAIVVCDISNMPRWLVDAAREAVEKQTGIPGTHVMIAATHTHTGPSLPRPSGRRAPEDEAAKIGRTYAELLPKLIANAVAAADQRRQPVGAFVAKATESRVSFNRRFWMRDGAVSWNPGKRDPAIIRAAGPIDPEVGVFYAATLGANSAPVLTFVNHALHPDTVGGTRLSADFPGVIARALALHKGPEMLTLFANGTCGNINHRDVAWESGQKGPEEANRIGTILAGAVLGTYSKLQPLPAGGRLQVRSAKVSLPLVPFTPQELEQAGLDVRSQNDRTREGFMKLVRARRIQDVAARESRPHEVEMQVITLGRDVAWVSWPGEIFVELGLSVKSGSPFAHTYNVELANGAIGYIPNQSAYPEGNYEVVNSRVVAGSGERLVSSALSQLAALHAAAPAP